MQKIYYALVIQVCFLIKLHQGTGTVGEGNREKPSPSSSSKARAFEMGLIQLQQLENGWMDILNRRSIWKGSDLKEQGISLMLVKRISCSVTYFFCLEWTLYPSSYPQLKTSKSLEKFRSFFSQVMKVSLKNFHKFSHYKSEKEVL